MNGPYYPNYVIEYCRYELKLAVTKEKKSVIESVNFVIPTMLKLFNTFCSTVIYLLMSELNFQT